MKPSINGKAVMKLYPKRTTETMSAYAALDSNTTSHTWILVGASIWLKTKMIQEKLTASA